MKKYHLDYFPFYQFDLEGTIEEVEFSPIEMIFDSPQDRIKEIEKIINNRLNPFNRIKEIKENIENVELHLVHYLTFRASDDVQNSIFIIYGDTKSFLKVCNLFKDLEFLAIREATNDKIDELTGLISTEIM